MKRSLQLMAGLALLALPLSVIAEGVHRPDQSPGTPEQVAAGKASFAMCGGCHGMEGEGLVGVGPRLNSTNYLAAAPNTFFEQSIKNGREGTNMIAWGAALGDETVANLVAYIRSWQTVAGGELDEGPLQGSVELGKSKWVDICSRCHGRSGAGYSEAGSGTGIGRSAFLNVASNGFLRSVIRTGKDNTAMRAFSTDSPVSVADLTDEEVDSIIQYLRANAW